MDALILFNKIAYGVFVCLYALEVYNFIFHRAIPNIRTAPAIRAAVIARLKQDCAERGLSSYTIVDLGSGNGLYTREIAKALPEAEVVGVELARLNVVWSCWRARRAGLMNLRYVRGNFLTYDVSKASAIVMYLIPPLMEPIGKKLHAEAAFGTLIVSNKFRLADGWEPVETLAVKTAYLHQGTVHLYRQDASPKPHGTP